MSLTVFGLLLVGALTGLCWKNGRAICTALVAVMLGVTIAGSSGALTGPSRSLVDGVRSGLDTMAASLFGGGR